MEAHREALLVPAEEEPKMKKTTFAINRSAHLCMLTECQFFLAAYVKCFCRSCFHFDTSEIQHEAERKFAAAIAARRQMEEERAGWVLGMEGGLGCCRRQQNVLLHLTNVFCSWACAFIECCQAFITWATCYTVCELSC